MKAVELYARVRHACHVEGLSQREAARRFGIDPKTVAKMLRHAVPPGYRRTKPPARPKLGAFTAIIDQILASDRSAPPKQRHTARRIHDRLREEHGFAGGYTIVKDYVRERQARTREVFVPLAHPPGHAQVDFGEAVAVIGGERRKLHLFRLDLPHSDACFVKAYPAERTEAFLDGHVAALAFLGGVPRSILYDIHQAGGRPHPGPRRTPADPRLRRAAVALPVPRPVRPARQGQRQGQGRGPGRLRPAQLPGPDPDRGELRRAQRAPRAALPRAAVRSAARPRRERRRAAGARPRRPAAAAAGALRRLRPPAGAGLRAVPGALRAQRLLGADRLRPPPGAGARLRRGGGDRLRGRGHRPARALLRARGLRLRPAALPGAAGAEDRRPRPGRAAAGLGPARGVRDPAPPARGPHGQGRQARVRPGPAVARDVPARGRPCGGARGPPPRRDRLRCREAPGAVPDRTPAAQAGPDGLPLPAAGHGRDHLGRSLHGPARPGRMSEAPQVLLTHHLKALRLPTFLREHDKLARQCAAEGVAHTGYLLRLVELELLERERRTVERRIRQARFPAVKSLDGFDFAAIPSLNKMLVLELARGEYVERRENVIALGPSGTGKTHVALGLGLAACQRGLSVGFVTAAALVHELLEAREERRLLRLQKQLAGYRLLIVDELGYVPLSPSGAELLFEVFSRRYERGSVVVTSNLPFDEWTSVFGSERLTGALLDRLTHHVHILEMNGESYRLQ